MSGCRVPADSPLPNVCIVCSHITYQKDPGSQIVKLESQEHYNYSKQE